MTKGELLSKMKNVMQREDDLALDMKLIDIQEWDSLSSIAIIALFKKLFDVTVDVSRLVKCETIADVVNLVSAKVD